MSIRLRRKQGLVRRSLLAKVRTLDFNPSPRVFSVGQNAIGCPVHNGASTEFHRESRLAATVTILGQNVQTVFHNLPFRSRRISGRELNFDGAPVKICNQSTDKVPFRRQKQP